MNRFSARVLVVFLFLAWMALFFASSQTRGYALRAFSTADSAYGFYDDFPILPDKSLLLFQVSCLLPICLLLYIRHKAIGASVKFIATDAAFLIGAIIVVLYWPAASVLLAGLFLFVYPWTSENVSRNHTYWILATLFLIALILRLEKIPNVANSPLQPDAAQYVGLAHSTTWLYDTAHREPFLAWVVRILAVFFPIPQDYATSGYLPLRLFTVYLSAIAAPAIYLVGGYFVSHRAAFLAALMFAMDKAFIYRSLQGLRLELLILGILAVLFLACAPSVGRFSSVWRAIALGIASGLLLLTRTACVPFIGFVYLWGLWRRYRTVKYYLIAAVLCCAISAPYFVYCWMEYGDPLYSGSYHVNKFYYMVVYGTGNPDTSSVPFVTPSHLMFGIYPWYKTMLLTLEGMADTLFGRYALRLFYLPFSVILIGASLVAYIRWIKDKERIMLVVSMLLLIGPMAFILGMLNHSSVVFDWRTIAHPFPLMAYAAAEGLLYLVGKAFSSTRNAC